MNTLTNMKFFDRKTLTVTETIFKIFFFIYAAASYCSVTYGHPVISFLMWPTALVGAIVLIQRLVLFKEYKSMPVLLPGIAFALCMGISILANFSYDLKLNIILFGYFIFYFCIIFTKNQTTTLDKLKSEMSFFSYLFIIYTTLAIVASFIIMFAGFSSIHHVNADNFEVIIGFESGRLWGVFLGPNGGATFSLVSMALMLGRIFKSKKFILRFLLSVNIVLHMLYITFSDSRTALVCILVVPLFTALLYAIGSDKQKKMRFVKPILTSILATVLCFTFVYSAKYSYNNIVTKFNAAQNQASLNKPEELQPEELPPDKQPSNDYETIDRDYNLEDDYSNRRFDLWKSGLEVYKDTPKNMVVGTSFYGMRMYAYEHLPNTYLVNNTQIDFANFHNEFVNILVAQGALGFSVIVWMILSIIIFVVKNIKNLNKFNSVEFATAAAVVLILAVASMFIPGVFYLFSPGSIAFWMFLGYAVMLLKKGNSQEDLV